jgi:hypothetical protein
MSIHNINDLEIVILRFFQKKSIFPSKTNGPYQHPETKRIWYICYEFTRGSFIFGDDEQSTETKNPNPKDRENFLTKVAVSCTSSDAMISFQTIKSKEEIKMVFTSMEQLVIRLSNNILRVESLKVEPKYIPRDYNSIDTITKWTEDILKKLGINFQMIGKNIHELVEYKLDDGSTEQCVVDRVKYALNENVSFYDDGTKTWKIIKFIHICANPEDEDPALISFYENADIRHHVTFKTEGELRTAIATYIQRYSGATTTSQQWHALGKLTDLLVYSMMSSQYSANCFAHL